MTVPRPLYKALYKLVNEAFPQLRNTTNQDRFTGRLARPQPREGDR